MSNSLPTERPWATGILLVAAAVGVMASATQRAKSWRYGNWFIGVPLPPGPFKHMPYVPITGTITFQRQ